MTRLKQNWKGLAAYAAVMLVLTALVLVLGLANRAGFNPGTLDSVGPAIMLLWLAVLVFGPFAVLADDGPTGWFKRYWKLLAYVGGLFPISVLAPDAVSLIYVGIGGVWLAVYFVKHGKQVSQSGSDDTYQHDGGVYGIGARNTTVLQHLRRFPLGQ
ncbi:hypothetical protein [Ruegeria sp. HKCCD8929]|uniref:hypothetical protein n=1 Tax=Ruegeria sp. HKCCD8929 TaxID=2683006 RepID=UPI001488FE5F|nr:hypothetical protein [Ruegeria sp. HKCCD8929]